MIIKQINYGKNIFLVGFMQIKLGDVKLGGKKKKTVKFLHYIE